MKKELRGLWKDILELVYPSGIYCISCGRPMDGRFPYSLCSHCVRLLHWATGNLCGKCGKPMIAGGKDSLCNDCSGEERLFIKGYTCVRYGEREKNIIHDFKYAGKSYYGEKLAQLIFERISGEDPDWELVIPVPMYRDKEKSRGYNQTAILGKCLARRLEIPFANHVLIRRVDTPPMSALSAGERRENVKDAFVVRERGKKRITGSAILLVDDVFTTGSTAVACTEVLLQAGARTVCVATFAAGGDGPN